MGIENGFNPQFKLIYVNIIYIIFYFLNKIKNKKDFLY